MHLPKPVPLTFSCDVASPGSSPVLYGQERDCPEGGPVRNAEENGWSNSTSGERRRHEVRRRLVTWNRSVACDYSKFISVVYCTLTSLVSIGPRGSWAVVWVIGGCLGHRRLHFCVGLNSAAGHFRAAFRLCFKASPSAKPFIWKCHM